MGEVYSMAVLAWRCLFGRVCDVAEVLQKQQFLPTVWGVGVQESSLFGGDCHLGLNCDTVYRAPVDHMSIRIRPTMISGVPLILGPGTRMCDPCVCAVFGEECHHHLSDPPVAQWIESESQHELPELNRQVSLSCLKGPLINLSFWYLI